MEPKTKVIDGVEYGVQPHMAERCLFFWATLVQLLTEPIAKALVAFVSGDGDDSFIKRVMDGGIQSVMDEDIDLAKVTSEIFKSLPDALKNLSEKITPAEYAALVKDFLSETIVHNTPVSTIFNTHFAGKMLHLHKVAGFAMEVNFGDFFDLIGGQTPEGDDEKRP